MAKPRPRVALIKSCACGGKAEIRGIGTKVFAWCRSCDMETGTYATARELAEAWNSPPSPASNDAGQPYDYFEDVP